MMQQMMGQMMEQQMTKGAAPSEAKPTETSQEDHEAHHK
jgi:hypothetical protein